MSSSNAELAEWVRRTSGTMSAYLELVAAGNDNVIVRVLTPSLIRERVGRMTGQERETFNGQLIKGTSPIDLL